MRIWLSKNGGTSLRDQLTTQLMLGVMSEELKAGEKLPSVREMARRCHIHANTASAAYRDLEARGWVEFRKGSGVYVRDLQSSRLDAGRISLDGLIERSLADTRAQGFSMGEVRTRIARWFKAAPIQRIIVVEPEPELGEILLAELREWLPFPATWVTLDRRFTPDELSGTAVVALMSGGNGCAQPFPPEPRICSYVCAPCRSI